MLMFVSNENWRKILLPFCAMIICHAITFGQDANSESVDFGATVQTMNKLASRTSELQEKLQKNTKKYLSKIRKQEKRIYKHLESIDSSVSKAELENIDKVYSTIEMRAKEKIAAMSKFNKYYVGGLDSVSTALKLLQSNVTGGLLGKNGNLTAEVDSKIANLQNEFGESAELGTLLENRLKYLQQFALSNKTMQQITKIRDNIKYYQLQVEEYKTILQHPDQLGIRAIRLAQKLPVFDQYFQKYSQLTTLFRLDGVEQHQSNLQNSTLQVRSILEKNIRDKFGVDLNSKVSNDMLGELRSNADQLSQLKSNVNGLLEGEKGKAFDLPEFKPNSQKTKSLFDRIEFGTNIQSTKSNSYFPASSDIGLSAGYKLSDKSIIGIGGSYKVGWGKDIRHIKLSHQGLSFRSFVDIKLKKSIWITGGSEWNYRSPNYELESLHLYTNWRYSALLGLQKKFTGGKLRSNAQILYDIFWRSHIPQGQPILFRVGYTLK